MNGADIINWRNAHRMKQSTLAEIVGVSQATISKWENGQHPLPRGAAMRLRDIIDGVHSGKLTTEIAFLAPQQQIKILTRGLGLQMVGMSAGFQQLWPQTAALMGQSMRDHLVNEAAFYCESGEFLREAEAGHLLMVTGVSNSMLAAGEPVPAQHRVRWHAIARHIDGELVHEVIYEDCAPDTPVGFEHVLRRSDLVPSSD